jgi:hypothetical protein
MRKTLIIPAMQGLFRLGMFYMCLKRLVFKKVVGNGDF